MNSPSRDLQADVVDRDHLGAEHLGHLIQQDPRHYRSLPGDCQPIVRRPPRAARRMLAAAAPISSRPSKAAPTTGGASSTCTRASAATAFTPCLDVPDAAAGHVPVRTPPPSTTSLSRRVMAQAAQGGDDHRHDLVGEAVDDVLGGCITGARSWTAPAAAARSGGAGRSCPGRSPPSAGGACAGRSGPVRPAPARSAARGRRAPRMAARSACRPIQSPPPPVAGDLADGGVAHDLAGGGRRQQQLRPVPQTTPTPHDALGAGAQHRERVVAQHDPLGPAAGVQAAAEAAVVHRQIGAGQAEHGRHRRSGRSRASIAGAAAGPGHRRVEAGEGPVVIVWREAGAAPARGPQHPSAAAEQHHVQSSSCRRPRPARPA